MNSPANNDAVFASAGANLGAVLHTPPSLALLLPRSSLARTDAPRHEQCQPEWGCGCGGVGVGYRGGRSSILRCGTLQEIIFNERYMCLISVDICVEVEPTANGDGVDSIHRCGRW